MDYLLHLFIMFAIFAILGVSLNLLVGYTGLLSVTHAAFYGVGAYATAIITTKFGVNFFLSVILGALLSGGIALLIGMVLSKFSDDYYALASLGFGVIVYSVMLNWDSLTRGTLGIPGIPKPAIFGVSFEAPVMFLALAGILLLFAYWISSCIVGSSFGRVLKAIREDEEALQVFGYHGVHYKLAIFVMSAGMAAIAGSLYASYISFIDPTSFMLTESIFIIALIIVGGLGNLKGSLLGALIMILLPEALRFVGFPDGVAAQMRQFVYGVLLILLMLYRPRGVVGEYTL